MKRTEILIKMALFGLSIVLALTCLYGCDLGLGGGSPGPGSQLSVTITPGSGYRPLTMKVVARNSDVEGGQFKVSLEGKTKENSTGIFHVTAYESDSEGTVTWTKAGYVERVAAFEIGFENEGPDPGRPVINGIVDLWTFQAKVRYVISFPYARDPEGGPVTLVDVHVQASLKPEEDTVFCPPYAGPGVYHARDRNGRLIENAFVIHSLWTGPLDVDTVWPEWEQSHSYKVDNPVRAGWFAYQCIQDHFSTPGDKPGEGEHWMGYWERFGSIIGTGLPFASPGYSEDGYPGAGINCGIDGWPQHSMPTQTTKITATFQDQDGAKTEESWEIPTMPYAICGAD